MYLISVHGHNDSSGVVVQTIGVLRMVKPLAPGGAGVSRADPRE